MDIVLVDLLNISGNLVVELDQKLITSVQK